MPGARELLDQDALVGLSRHVNERWRAGAEASLSRGVKKVWQAEVKEEEEEEEEEATEKRDQRKGEAKKQDNT